MGSELVVRSMQLAYVSCKRYSKVKARKTYLLISTWVYGRNSTNFSGNMWEHKLKGAICLLWCTDFYCLLNIRALARWLDDPGLKLSLSFCLQIQPKLPISCVRPAPTSRGGTFLPLEEIIPSAYLFPYFVTNSYIFLILLVNPQEIELWLLYSPFVISSDSGTLGKIPLSMKYQLIKIIQWKLNFNIVTGDVPPLLSIFQNFLTFLHFLTNLCLHVWMLAKMSALKEAPN